ncbi:FUSC family protein [Streptomyces sp. NPDC058401]|uniref:FUSC family protein n=1 Tax=Streptomyces sp. NPDC058401 TaxID=3346480 RepID=UPI00365A19A1
MARSVVALTVPAALAVVTGHYDWWVLLSIGAIGAVLCDTYDAYHLRFLNIAVPQVASAVGWVLGALVVGRGWVVVATMAAVALGSGVVSAIGPVSSLAGMLFLLMAVIGADTPMPGQWFQAPLLLMSGGLVVCALSLLGWPLRRRAPERLAVAAVYRSVADTLDAAGTDRWSPAMTTVTRTVNSAQDLLLLRRTRHPDRDPHLRALLAQLQAATPLLEALPAAQRADRAVTSEASAAVRALARAIAADQPAPPPRLARHGGETEALDAALRHATGVHAGTDDTDGTYHQHHHAAAPAVGWTGRLREGARDLFATPAGLHYGLRLALCIALAEALVTVADLPRSYWVALTVTFVLKPDAGSVFTRALLRALGATGGALVAGLVLTVVPRGGWELPVIALAALALPLASARSYALQTSAITILIVLFTDMMGHQGSSLVGARIIDTLLGVVIVLTAGYLFWPVGYRTLTGTDLAQALRDTASYAERITPGDRDATLARSTARRRAYRSLAGARTTFQHALTEPPPISTHATTREPLLQCLQHALESVTATATRLDHGATPPPPADITAVADALRTLAGALTGPGSAVAPRAPADLPDDSPLAGAALEIRTAFTTLAAPDAKAPSR